ncbi:hypothetical protein Patl1_11000 [Pistacia atlantica]|uniref:Uncharacterized protein n=1 Tax=Pistacia atlantica TaxID=434234 RepID=A0ACC1A781_9ROSI|nr:hypothetical protein Patl1_11000 [Pistacia atlantica]
MLPHIHQPITCCNIYANQSHVDNCTNFRASEILHGAQIACASKLYRYIDSSANALYWIFIRAINQSIFLEMKLERWVV